MLTRFIAMALVAAGSMGCATSHPLQELPTQELREKHSRLSLQIEGISDRLTMWYGQQARAATVLESASDKDLESVSKLRTTDDILDEQRKTIRSLLARLQQLEDHLAKVASEIERRTPAPLSPSTRTNTHNP